MGSFSGIVSSYRDLLVKSISSKLLHLVKTHLHYNSIVWQIPKVFPGGINILDKKCNNFHIRKCLIQDSSCYPKALVKWKQIFSLASIDMFRELLPNKIKYIA